jgi:hypothetical protein
MFVPLMHPAGEAQVDFGEALVVIAGVEQKAHYLVMDLPHSDDCFVVGAPGRDDGSFSRRPCEPLRTSAAFRRGYCTTTPRSQ